jgi:molecular chaperone HscB
MINFFSLFELPVSFDVDLNDLEKRYFTVQRICHPDRLVGRPPSERQQAILKSMQANEAYETLKTPLLRARHMLALQGVYVGGEKDTVKPTPELLMEIMEMREVLEDATTVEQLQKLHEQNQRDIAMQTDALSQAFARNDLETATEYTLRLGYLIKIADELRLKLKAV